MWRQGLFLETSHLTWSTWTGCCSVYNRVPAGDGCWTSEILKRFFLYTLERLQSALSKQNLKYNACILVSVHLNFYCSLIYSVAKTDICELIAICISSFPTDRLGKLSLKGWNLSLTKLNQMHAKYVRMKSLLPEFSFISQKRICASWVQGTLPMKLFYQGSFWLLACSLSLMLSINM